MIASGLVSPNILHFRILGRALYAICHQDVRAGFRLPAGRVMRGGYERTFHRQGPVSLAVRRFVCVFTSGTWMRSTVVKSTRRCLLFDAIRSAKCGHKLRSDEDLVFSGEHHDTVRGLLS